MAYSQDKGTIESDRQQKKVTKIPHRNIIYVIWCCLTELILLRRGRGRKWRMCTVHMSNGPWRQWYSTCESRTGRAHDFPTVQKMLSNYICYCILSAACSNHLSPWGPLWFPLVFMRWNKFPASLLGTDTAFIHSLLYHIAYHSPGNKQVVQKENFMYYFNFSKCFIAIIHRIIECPGLEQTLSNSSDPPAMNSDTFH